MCRVILLLASANLSGQCLRLAGGRDGEGHMVDDDAGPRTFVGWVAGSQHSLLRTAYLLTGDLHRAEDLVQDALVKVAARWDRLVSGDPDAYARRIIARTNISWWRRYRREHVGQVTCERAWTSWPKMSPNRTTRPKRGGGAGEAGTCGAGLLR